MPERNDSCLSDWIRDKESSKFAFPGLCQEKSFVPLDIWKAGEPNSNLIETVHRDANREGVHCTLVGGLLRGQRFDSFKVATLKVNIICFSDIIVFLSTTVGMGVSWN